MFLTCRISTCHIDFFKGYSLYYHLSFIRTISSVSVGQSLNQSLKSESKVIQVFSFFPTSVEVGKPGSTRRKRSHLSLNGSRPSSFIGRNVKVGASKRPDPEFIENGVLGTGQAEII